MKIFIFAIFILKGVYNSQSSKTYILEGKNLFVCRLVESEKENEKPAPLALLSLKLSKNNDPEEDEIILAYLTACPVNRLKMKEIMESLKKAEADSNYAEKVQRLFGLESADSSPSISSKLFTSESFKYKFLGKSSDKGYNYMQIKDVVKTHKKNVKKKFLLIFKINSKMQVTSIYFLRAKEKRFWFERTAYIGSPCYKIDESKLFPPREHKPFKITLPVYKKGYIQEHTKTETNDFFKEFLKFDNKNSDTEESSVEQETKAPNVQLLVEYPVVNDLAPNVTIEPKYKATAPLNSTNEPTVVLRRRYKSKGSTHSTMKSSSSTEANFTDENELLRDNLNEGQGSDSINVCREVINSDGCSLESKVEEGSKNCDRDGR